jgi:hypothetical protein
MDCQVEMEEVVFIDAIFCIANALIFCLVGQLLLLYHCPDDYEDTQPNVSRTDGG